MKMLRAICSLLVILALNSVQLVGQDHAKLNTLHARTSPQWLTDGIIYQIQPRAFTKEGTLNAASAKLNHIANVGATIVYLCPVFVMDGDTNQTSWSKRQKASGMNSPHNLYKMKDYYNVDPEFGTNQDLKTFVTRAHELGLKVILDMVYLHVGMQAIFLKDNPDYIQLDESGKPLLASWNWPKLNFKNSELRNYLTNNMIYWVKEYNVDGFRCDVSDQVPLDFWEESRVTLEKIKPSIAMLAEGERTNDQLKAFDINYSFKWFNTLSKIYEQEHSASTLRDLWTQLVSERPQGHKFIRYIDNHDIANDDWDNRIDKRWGIQGANAALVLSYMLDGVPFIYNGQEIADKARHSIFGKLPIDWSNVSSEEGKKRFTFLQKLNQIRKSESILSNGNLQWIPNSQENDIVSFERVLKGKKLLVVVNLRNKKNVVEIKGIENQHLKNSILMKGVKGQSKSSSIELEPYGYVVYRI